MSKNLEKEYKALVNSEVPDLWARIEAGLDEKESVNKKKIFNFSVWGTVAAACVCAGIVIPVFRSYLYMGGSSKSSTPQYTNNAPAAGAAYDTAADNAAPADMAVSADTPEAAPDKGGGSDNGAVEEGVMLDGAAGAAEADAEDTQQEEAVFEADVEILSVDLRRDSGPAYKARVIRSDNHDLEADTEIEIVSYYNAQDDMVIFEQGEIRELTLCRKNDEREKTYYLVYSGTFPE